MTYICQIQRSCITRLLIESYQRKTLLLLSLCLLRHSGGFRWKSGQCGSLNSTALTNSAKKNKENALQKVQEESVYIYVHVGVVC